MNKSELELQNIQSIIDEMPVAERALCVSMVSSLMASVGHPVHGRVFMIAVAFTNCQVAVYNIKMGLVNEDGSIPEKFMQGDGKVSPIIPKELSDKIKDQLKPLGTVDLLTGKSQSFGGHKAEVLAVDECPVEQGLNAALEAKSAERFKGMSPDEIKGQFQQDPVNINVTIDSIEGALANRIKDSKLLPKLKGKPGSFDA